MPIFGKRSNKNLNECHEDLRMLFRVVIEKFDCSVIKGKRGEEEQEAAFAAMLSKLHYPDSPHNKEPLSHAADVIPWPVNWKDRDRFYFFGGYVKGIATELFATGKMNHEIRWGGDWDGDTNVHDQSFMDLPHFELIGVSENEDR
jgi:peptidoglycan L-alanyl-D-glutamate endopeptidase CwlK